MTTMTGPAAPPRAGRVLLFLGLACAAAGVLLYAAQMAAGRLNTPWYMPALATLAAVLALLALTRRPNLWRAAALVLLALLAGFEWWFLLGYSRLPAYAGPVSAGEPFPAFRAARADGTPFTENDLKGNHATALVFFRGHW